jgi:hypothetical protein
LGVIIFSHWIITTRTTSLPFAESCVSDDNSWRILLQHFFTDCALIVFQNESIDPLVRRTVLLFLARKFITESFSNLEKTLFDFFPFVWRSAQERGIAARP